MWKVYKVRVKDLNGDWYDLEPLGSDKDEIDDGSGKPTKYRLLGNVVRLSAPPLTGKVTLTAGIQIWYQREFDKFTSADTTQNPGFMSSYHYLLAMDASATYLAPTDSKLSNKYLILFENGLEKLAKTYAQRNDDPKVVSRMTPKVEDTK